jgi:hypothetical protein
MTLWQQELIYRFKKKQCHKCECDEEMKQQHFSVGFDVMSVTLSLATSLLGIVQIHKMTNKLIHTHTPINNNHSILYTTTAPS